MNTDDNGAYCPTQEEIALATEDIQRGWDEATRQRRLAHKTESVCVTEVSPFKIRRGLRSID